MPAEYQRDYLLRLPLPLAQLYRRAHNAPDPRARHNNTFFLFEATIKLVASVLIAVYRDDLARGGERTAALDELLAKLNRPMLGHWLAILRELAKHDDSRPDAASHPLGALRTQLTQPRRELPGALALYRRIKNGVDGQPAGDETCSLMQLFDALVQYRNLVMGHGADREDAFYERDMAPLLFPAANDLLAERVFDLLLPPGARFVYLTEVRLADRDAHIVSFKELIGLASERANPLSLDTAQAAHLRPNQVALLWPGRIVPLVLDPLLVFRETESGEELRFLNCDRNGKLVEYLSYTSGATESDPSTAEALAALLRQVTGRDPPVLACQPPVATAGPPGDFEIVAELGRGGMGVVYLARQRSLGRWVALKMLPADLAGDEVALARLRREIRLLAQCDDPHIVKVLTSGTTPDGQVYYAMEYVPGADLETVWRELAGPHRHGSAAQVGGTTWSRAVLTASRKQREQTVRSASRRGDDRSETGSDAPSAERPLRQSFEEPVESGTGLESGTGQPSEESEPSNPQSAIRNPQSNRVVSLPPLPELPDIDDETDYDRRVATLVRDAARALQIVHDHNIVHRDMKPANLMLTPDGSRVVLMDFGLAKGHSQSLTASRQAGLLGTLRYAAPEQLAAASVKVGPPADVRGLGVTLWELLTRQRLFGEAEDEKQLASWVLTGDVPRLRTVDASLDRDLEAIVAKATERGVQDRIQTARELADYLDLYLAGKPLPIRIPGPAELLRRWARENIRLIGSAAAALILVAAALAFFDHRAALKHAETVAQGLVDSLKNADADTLKGVLQQLQIEANQRWATPALVALAATEAPSPIERRARLNARLALVERDPKQVPALVEELLSGPVSYVGVVCDQLAPYAPQIEGDLWTLLRDEVADAPRRFRAGLALASYATAAGQWTTADGAFLAEQLVAANPEHQPRLRGYLRPICERLLDDLERIFADGAASEGRQLGSANALADFAAADAPRLARLLVVASGEQYAVLYPLVAEAHDPVVRQFFERLAREPPAADMPPIERVALGQRRAGAAITLLRQGEREAIFDALRVDSGDGLRGDTGGGLRGDPESLTQFVHRCRARGVVPADLLECVKRADASRQTKTGAARRTDDGVLYALVLALGEFELADLPGAQRDAFVKQLANWYADDPSSAVHGATGWLLRHWKQDKLAKKVDQTPVPYTPEREWFTLKFAVPPSGGDSGVGDNSTSQSPRSPGTTEPAEAPTTNEAGPAEGGTTFYSTFVVFPAGEYLIGSAKDEAEREGREPRHAVKLTRPIAVSDREITWEQYNSFDNRSRHDAVEKQVMRTLTPEEPALGVNWYEAVAYCRWLTKCAGMAEDDQAYGDPASLDRERFPADPDPQAAGAPRNWPVNLEKRGYRLPTEAEWEMVGRGGTNTTYSFGNDARLLGGYGWFHENSEKWSHAVGRLRPSRRGLFDIHGNLVEWCHDWYGDYGDASEDPTAAAAGSYRVNRGGGWDYDAAICRLASRMYYMPVGRRYDLGFRVALVPFSHASEPASEAASDAGSAGRGGARSGAGP